MGGDLVSLYKLEVEGIDSVLNEIARLTDTRRVRGDLEDVLDRQFDQAQSYVHEHTGALRASGSKSTSYNPVDKQWSGGVAWDDPAAAFEIYINAEQDPDAGHADFWNSLTAAGWSEAYVAAVLKHYRGDDE